MSPFDYVTIDFESLPIQQRPAYPPKSVGVSIKWPRQPSRYYAWGHPIKNNCGESDAMAALERVWDSGLPILCHNAKFDIHGIMVEWYGAPLPCWDRIHDTMFLAYLCDPHSRRLGLKELCEDLLGWAPEERDRVADWIMAHKDVLHQTYGAALGLTRPTPKRTGAYIGYAPGDLVGEYACGDTDRTAALFDHLYPLVVENGMLAAYNRERQVLPILARNEREGMQVDLPLLIAECEIYGEAFEKAEAWLRKKLRAPGLNFDADQDLAAILLERGIVPPENWSRTKSTKSHPNGQLAVNKDALRPEHFSGPDGAAIASVLGYRNRLTTCLGMFMRPWRDQALVNNGRITTNWNQTRGGASGGGTRTGRPSTDKHNFLNLSKDFESKRDDGYVHPDFLDVPNLPLVRKYIIADDPDSVFAHRDFSGQEMRVFAHFEQGDLWEQFNDNPALDPHEFIGEELMRVAQREIERTRVKNLNFQGLYGGGIPALQLKLRCSIKEAKELKAFHDKALPGRKILNEEIARLINRGLPIHTWGGRLYFKEPSTMRDGRMMDFLYKLINYLIQGSAADLTKQTLIDWESARGPSARFLVTVYDEINISVPKTNFEREMAILRESMERPRLTVPMLSDGKVGYRWGDLKKCA
jgi:DNA polymerase I-like protein with 3'-5' exonuclease and polymerase domains